ncbi:uncharacterized protein LOC122933277 isoform X2 [Bufo gargarizans]|uniref:uncharacterized protein LOC122933277 isoform X2 n=1 Tax=Bufo gargarizans TaxID=30331 RepID=UPI001CF3DF56|nr:uncharacterized protein LOC122933277 isoform X2 [Bufo gargarizans]
MPEVYMQGPKCSQDTGGTTENDRALLHLHTTSSGNMILRLSFLLAMLYHGYLSDLEDSNIFPKLVAFPDYHGYVIGETISLTCLVSEESRNDSSVFYKDSAIISQNNSSYMYIISRLDNSHVGIYMCETRGRKSNEKAIHVYEPLPPPLISSEQPNIPGMPVTMKCSTPGLSEWKQIKFYRNGMEIFMATSFLKMVIDEISISIQRTDAVYFCSYQVQKLGRLIDSKPSKNLHVSILDFTEESPSTVSNMPTYQTDREIITKTPSDTTEYSTSASASQMTTEHTEYSTSASASQMTTEHTGENTSTIQSYTLLQWTYQTNWINSSSSDNDVSLTWIYYCVGGLLSTLMVVLLIFLLCRFNLPMKRKKNRPMKTSFWMNYSTRRKSRKATPSFHIRSIIYEKEQNPYDRPDQCTSFMNSSSSLKPSNNQGAFGHGVDLGSNIYDIVQEPAPISSTYVTLDPPKNV